MDPTCLNDTVFAGIEASVGLFNIAVLMISTTINPGSQVYK